MKCGAIENILKNTLKLEEQVGGTCLELEEHVGNIIWNLWEHQNPNSQSSCPFTQQREKDGPLECMFSCLISCKWKFYS
jgi:hypothetical protein